MARPRKTQNGDNDAIGDDVPVIDRNPGSRIGVDETVDPNVIGSSADQLASGSGSNPEAPKKRGRRSKAELEAAGETSGKTGKAGKARDLYITEKMLTVTLMTVNNTLAAKFHQPAFVLEQKEAEILSPAVLGVLDHYGWAKIRAKYGVWANLFMALGMVYGSKVQMAIGLGKASEALERAREFAPGNPEGAALMQRFANG